MEPSQSTATNAPTAPTNPPANGLSAGASSVGAAQSLPGPQAFSGNSEDGLIPPANPASEAQGRFILRSNSRSTINSPTMFTLNMPITNLAAQADNINHGSEMFSSDDKAPTHRADLPANYSTDRPDHSSFEMFQKPHAQNNFRRESSQQIFRFDSAPSNSFVRTFYQGQAQPLEVGDSTTQTVQDPRSSSPTRRLSSSHISSQATSSQPQARVEGSSGSAQPSASVSSRPPSPHSRAPQATSQTPSQPQTQLAQIQDRSTQGKEPSPPGTSLQIHGSSTQQAPNQNSVMLSSESAGQGPDDSQVLLNSAINSGCGHQYVDITEYLNMPQYIAARKLGIPASTLSKRWKEAVRTRKWPYRSVQKLDKEITTLLHNVPQGPDAPPLPKDIEQTLGMLLRKRQEELNPVIVRI